jgi:hypothetical protein
MKHLTIGVLLFSIVLAGKASNPDECRIEPARALSWSQFATIKPDVEPPSTALYAGCGKRLIYVAAVHSNESDGKTFVAVRQAFERHRPHHVVLEGFPASMGINPAPLIEHASKVMGTSGDAEPYLSVRIAQSQGASFSGGEPDDSDILASVREKGMSAGDLFAIYVLRQIEQWVRETRIASHRDPALDGLIRDYARSFATDAKVEIADIAAVSTLAGFRTWYASVNGLDFMQNYRAEDAWPVTPETNRPTNKLIVSISDAREAHILGEISRALSRHRIVLVVYGASHHDIHAPALQAAFGMPTRD